MHRLLSLTALVVPLIISRAAIAAPEEKGMKAAFEGTITSTYPDGRKGHLWLSADGTYQAAGRKGDRSSGHWSVKGEKVCLHQSKPLPVPFQYCTPKPTSDHWTAKAVSGEPIKVSLTSGGRPG